MSRKGHEFDGLPTGEDARAFNEKYGKDSGVAEGALLATYRQRIALRERMGEGRSADTKRLRRELDELERRFGDVALPMTMSIGVESVDVKIRPVRKSATGRRTKPPKK